MTKLLGLLADRDSIWDIGRIVREPFTWKQYQKTSLIPKRSYFVGQLADVVAYGPNHSEFVSCPEELVNTSVAAPTAVRCSAGQAKHRTLQSLQYKSDRVDPCTGEYHGKIGLFESPLAELGKPSLSNNGKVEWNHAYLTKAQHRNINVATELRDRWWKVTEIRCL